MNIALILLLIILSIVGVIVSIKFDKTLGVIIILVIVIGSVALSILSDLTYDAIKPILLQPSCSVQACYGDSGNDYQGCSLILPSTGSNVYDDDSYNYDDYEDNSYFYDDSYYQEYEYYEEENDYNRDEYTCEEEYTESYDSTDFDTSIYADLDYIVGPYNSDEITFYVGEASLDILCDFCDGVPTTLSQRALPGTHVQLVEYYTGNAITMTTDSYGVAHFTDIPAGTYYYTIEKNGYEPFHSDDLVELYYDPSVEEDILPWGVDLQPYGSSFLPSFDIKVLAPGDAYFMEGTEITVCVYDENDPDGSYSYYPLYTDENGYLTEYHGLNDTDYYRLASFRIEDGLTIGLHSDEYGLSTDLTPTYGKSSYTVVLS